MQQKQERAYEQLSPFEIKKELTKVAQACDKHCVHMMLNAGRGAPNWIATTPREAFFTLGQFAIAQARRAFNPPELDSYLAGTPEQKGIADRFDAWARSNQKAPGISFLNDAINYGVEKLDFEREAFIYELADSVIGDRYPSPPRMLKYAEQVVHTYLMREMCKNQPPEGKYDLFAVEGATAAIYYIINSLMDNKLLQKGDTIALGVPIFTPYIEIPKIEERQFKTIEIVASQKDEWQYPPSELEKLADPAIKVFLVVNPNNPSSYELRQSQLDSLAEFVKTKRPDLIVITDDVYCTFGKGFRSIMAELPRNTIGIYSYSKYFGCTGWRLGVVAIHQDNIFDEKIAKLPDADRQALNRRYGRLTLEPEKVKFIDRMVADSRQIALNHTAGLSSPQQVQMTLFSLFGLLESQNQYKQAVHAILHQRLQLLLDGLEIKSKPTDLYNAYYYTLDLEHWMRQNYGEDLVKFVKQNYEPVDFIFRLAEQFSTVLLNGDGFHAPDWSVRVSLANLSDAKYETIGEEIRTIAEQYAKEWKESKSLQIAQ
jgi:aspartate 4-decarboxylase